MKVLIAGPDHGMEFGWRLMRWQAKIRHMSKNYDETYIITTPNMFSLYEDFAFHIEEYSTIDAQKDRWRYNNVEVDHVYPTKEICKNDEKYPSKFINYALPKKGWHKATDIYPEKKYILIHPRKKLDGREWGYDKWIEYIEMLLKATNNSIYIIGDKTDTYDIIKMENINKITDWRNSINIICLFEHAKLCIGPSSGPMHLASLCGCSHLVWTDNKRWDLGCCKGTNRERYEKYWNPFSTPVTVVDNHGWNPQVDIILDKTKELLSK